MARKTRAKKKRAPRRRAAPRGILKAIGDELRARRESWPTRLTQLELSREAGVGQNQTGLIERGVANVTIVVLHAILTRLDIPIADFFTAVQARHQQQGRP